MADFLQVVDSKLVVSAALALFAVLVGTRASAIGVRDYILVVTVASLASVKIVEAWFLDASMTTCAIVGFSTGFLADDVYLNLKATIPKFVKDTVHDVFTSARDKIRKFLGLGK